MKHLRVGRELVAPVALAMLMGVTLPAAAQRDVDSKFDFSRGDFRTGRRDPREFPGDHRDQDQHVRVILDRNLSSRSARPGDRISATVSRRERGDFPAGARFFGRVIEARPAGRNDGPGILDAAFDTLELPSGRRIRIDGELAGVEWDGINDERRDGRSTRATRDRNGKFDWKWVGYGAAGGTVLGGITGRNNWGRGLLLGALGGAAYSYVNRDRDRDRERFRDVELRAGDEFVIALRDPIRMDDFRGRFGDDDCEARNRRLSGDRRFEDLERGAGERLPVRSEDDRGRPLPTNPAEGRDESRGPGPR